jgi:hypothetical protein
MPYDSNAAVQVGAGIAARGMQLKFQREQQAAEMALFPLKMQDAQMGLQTRAMQLEADQLQKVIMLKNQKGAVELSKILADPNFSFNQPDARQKIAGLIARYPHITDTPTFKWASKGLDISENFQKAENVAKINAASRDYATSTRFVQSLVGRNSAERYGEIEKKELIPGVFLVRVAGSANFKIIKSNQEKALTLQDKSLIRSRIATMRKGLWDLPSGSPEYNDQLGAIRAMESEIETMGKPKTGATAPDAIDNPLANPPPLKANVLKYDRSTGLIQ